MKETLTPDRSVVFSNWYVCARSKTMTKNDKVYTLCLKTKYKLSVHAQHLMI